MLAFGQHYARNWALWHSDPNNPYTHWEAIVRADFGSVSTPAQALLSNPLAVAHHVAQNLGLLPHAVMKTIFSPLYPFSYQTSFALGLSIAALLLGWLRSMRKRRMQAIFARIIQKHQGFFFWEFSVLIMLVPIILSIMFIAPNRHYLLMLGVILGVGLVAPFFSEDMGVVNEVKYASLALICLVPLLLVYPLSLLAQHYGRGQLNLKTIECLRLLGIKKPVHLLEAEGGYGFYVGENYNRVAEYDKNTNFFSFLNDSSIDMVVVSDGLSSDDRFNEDPEWLVFIDKPEKYGFIHVDIPDVVNRYILLKRSLLDP
ncbi:MAG: hypothetical protein ACP5U1_15740 [Desulfomonilaceae bacterium]